MNKRVVVILMVIAILCTTFMGVEVNAKDDLTIKLKENLIPLKTTKSENGFEDLMPLKEILKDKKIIGMGEATHGTAEFFEMKHRMFEFLVEEMGYRVFAIEAEFGGSQIVNEYILEGKGNIDNCFRAMKFWTWNTEEVADMIRWMKDYNENLENERKIKFYGYDMQSVDNSIKHVLDYLEMVGSDNITEYRKNIVGFENNYSPNKTMVKNLNQNIEKVYNDIVKNKDEYIKNSSEEEYELILQHINIINQWIRFKNDKDNFETRDYSMAQNIKWILEHENTYYGNDKIMLWAHNGHVAKEYMGLETMGKYLKDIYNEEYYPIGFDFYQGSFAAMPMTFYGTHISGGLASFYINSSPAGSYADEINKTDIPISFLDFKSSEKDKVVSDFISSKLHLNNIGATYFGKLHNVNPRNKIVPIDSYDGIIFVKSTTAAKQRKYYEKDLRNGDKVLMSKYIFNIAIFLNLFILLYCLYKKNSKSNRNEMHSDKFYILGKYRENDIYINSLDKMILKANNYLNSISLSKYIAIFSSIILIMSIVTIKVKSLDILSEMYVGSIGVAIFQFIIFVVVGIGEILLFYILPISILKHFSEDKVIKLNHIIIVSIIVAIFISKSYLSAGILMFLVNALLCFISAFIYSYTYSLFYYKRKKPIAVVSILAVLESIMFMLVLFIISKI